MLGHRSQPLYPQDGTADLIRMMGFLMASIDNVCMCVCVCVCGVCVRVRLITTFRLLNLRSQLKS